MARFTSTSRSSAFGVLALTVLLALLASLQYRWVGQISEAERARMRSGARERAEQLARDFDRELTRAFIWLQVEPAVHASRDWARYAERYVRWSRLAADPGLVKEVLLAEVGPSPRLARFEPTSGAFLPTEWPTALAGLRGRLAANGPGPSTAPRPFRRGPIHEDIPALVAPIMSFEEGGPHRGEGAPGRLTAFTIVTLDLDNIRTRLLPALAQRHFGVGSEADYDVLVTRQADPQAVVFDWRPRPSGVVGPADATAGLLWLRLEDVGPEDRAALPWPGPPGGAGGDRPRRAGGPWNGPTPARDADAGYWRVLITHRSGSVDQVVAAARRRNLAVSAAILALLLASVALVVVSSQRARRLAEQQIEFVAGVSHELRTPLAVICSAGENLADGLVDDREMVRKYGAMVRDEGRRLAEIVEQVLDFAGSHSERRPRRVEELSVASLVEECLATAAPALREAGIDPEVAMEADLPPVRGDRGALRRALQNLIENAIKYGGDGRFIGVRAALRGGTGPPEVLVTVADRGLGIARAETGSIFEPFFRGETATSRQIRGSGLGLSLVKHIVEAHGGRVSVETNPGRGSAFTVTLPASAPVVSLSASEPAHGTTHTAG